MKLFARSALVALALGALGAPLAAQDITPASDGPARQGFFLGLGVAGGQFDNECDICADADPVNGFGSHLKLGGTLSPKFRLGVEFFGMTTAEGQFSDLGGGPTTRENIGDAVASLWFYPSASGNFWIQGGVGGVAYLADVESDQKYTAVSLGGVLGVGYDLRLGSNGSLTPYIRWALSGEGTLKDENGNDTGPAEWKTTYIAIGVDYVFH
jgi:hypothetical protein